MYDIANLSSREREELFSETAKKIGTSNAIIEKDFWVVWVLSKIFSNDKLSRILMFKGGTSLSKVFDLIGRFSEDVDLILDWTLVTDESPYKTRSNNKQDKFNKAVNESAKEYDDEYVYLYHVKKGFNGSMRDLTNQVFIAANRILEDLKSDKNYLKSVYAKMQDMDNYKKQVDSEEEFLSIFSGRNLCFVLAVKDSGTNRRLDDIESFTSNIAKFSLNELIDNMRSLDVSFRITQINRPDEGN